MASNPAKPKTSRWGSLLSGAVAGLESRLDNIFAEEEERAAQDRAAAARNTQETKSTVPAASSKRLQERLAKAVATQKSPSQPSSELPSRSVTPLLESVSPRVSTSSRSEVEVPSLPAVESAKAQPDEDVVETLPEPVVEPSSSTLLTSCLPINPARSTEDSASSRPTTTENDILSSVHVDSDPGAPLSAPHVAPAVAPAVAPPSNTQDAVPNTQHQEEMYAHLERIDALQAKLQYLARETVAAAKEANAAAQPGSVEQKVAEKDERIALLMEEGSKLGKTEMRHLGIIKKLRSKTADDDKAMSDLQKKLTRLELSERDLKARLKQADQVEKLANERWKRLQGLEKDLDTTKNDFESNKATVAILRKQLADAEKRTDEAERAAQNKSFQADSKKVSELQEQLSELAIEKKLAEDRSIAEAKRLAEESRKEKEKSSAREGELTAEISNMESRIEALRSRAEEATSHVTGDSQAKLLRQVETLQTQYSLAAENWRTIEASLNSRIAAIEKERDEYVKREADMRKKARDVSSKSRRAEDELERMTEESENLAQQFHTQANEMKALQTRLKTAENTIEESKADLERQRRVLESELNQRLDEEKSRIMQHGLGINTDVSGIPSSRTQSPTSFLRKSGAQEPSSSLQSRRKLARVSSHDQTTYSASRRPSALGTPLAGSSRASVIPDTPSPGVSRQGSAFSLSQLNGLVHGMPPTPSIQTTDVDAEDGFEFHASASPQHTINDVISASTVHTGPSVQLVERMSSSIRRLESEKAAHKDELARLVAQRDESRNELVTLMREMESKRQSDDKSSKLEKEFAEVKQRYEACLEILGEKEEEVEELKADVVELKRIYRDLAERSMK